MKILSDVIKFSYSRIMILAICLMAGEIHQKFMSVGVVQWLCLKDIFHGKEGAWFLVTVTEGSVKTSTKVSMRRCEWGKKKKDHKYILKR